MALLNGARVALALGLAAFSVGPGCSLVLDPDDLTAELRDGAGDGEVDGADTSAADSVADDTQAEDDTVSDTVTPPDTAGDTVVADTELPDTVVADTELPDTVVADTELPDTMTDTTVVDTDTVQGPNVVIAHSGALGCELDYKTQFLDLTACPRTCPEMGGWTLVFDATQSTGVTSYSWDFSVTSEYKITPATSTEGRVEVNLDVPSCGLASGSSLGSGRIYATLHVNGDAAAAYPTQLDFSVRYLSQTCGATQGNCPDP